MISCNQRPWKIGSTCKNLILWVDKDQAVKDDLAPHPHSGSLPYLKLKKSLIMSKTYLMDLFVRAQNVLFFLCVPVSVKFFSICCVQTGLLWLTAVDALIVLCTFKGTTHLFLPPDCA